MGDQWKLEDEWILCDEWELRHEWKFRNDQSMITEDREMIQSSGMNLNGRKQEDDWKVMRKDWKWMNAERWIKVERWLKVVSWYKLRDKC